MVTAFGGKLFVAGGITVETTPPTPRRDAFFYTPVTGVWTQLTSAPPDALDIAAGYVAAFGNMAYFGMGASFETGFRENNYNMYSVDSSGVITLLSSCEAAAFQREDGVLVAMPLEVGCVAHVCNAVRAGGCSSRASADRRVGCLAGSS